MVRAIVSGLANGGIYALLAVGIVLVYKGSRVLNFAQGEMGTFGLFIAFWLIEEQALPWFVGWAGAIAVVAMIGLIFERVVVRNMAGASRLSVAVATIGLLLFLVAIEYKLFGPSPRILEPPIAGLGMKIASFYVSPTQVLALATAIALGAALAMFLKRTDFGLGLLAASQDTTATRLVGLKVARVSAFTWAAGGAVSALAALLIEPTIGLFAAGFMTALFVRGLAGALLGGLTSLPGAFAGGLAVGVIEAVAGQRFVQSTFPGIQSVSVMVIIVLVLLIRPRGLFGKAVTA
ncbi:MAG TPA: branched-chain amino acid ABC transporter permease [Actinomycetota bacterium]|nr:branched-chain amino acid ABC transporter permease [Actinomycetota bacterium]